MALHYGEENLGVTDVFGEDVGPPLGGVFVFQVASRNQTCIPQSKRYADDESQ